MDDAMHEAVREALLDLEPDEVLDAAQAAHLEGCEECQAFAHALRSVDDQLAELPSFEAPAALVERTRSAIAEQPREREPSRGTLGLFGALLAGILSGLGALLGLLFAPFRGKSHGPWAIALPAVAAVVVVVVGGIGTLGYRSEPESASVDDAVEPGELNDRLAQMVFEDSVADEEESTEEPNGWDEAAVGGDSGGTGHRGNGQIGQMLGGEGGRGPRGLFWGADGDDDGVILDGRGERDRDGRFDVDLPTTSGTTAVVNGAIEAPAMEESSRVAQGYGPQLRALGYADQEDIEQAPPANWRAVEEDAEGEVAPAGRPAFTTLTTTSSRDTSTLLPLRDEERTEGLSFRAPTGYWANTYLPGDPAVRALRARLADEPAALRLAELALPSDPSFEAPRVGALALALEADRTGVEGPARVRLSVGLRGAAQRAGRRPTLRTQVLVDLRRPLDEADRGRVRALLDALARRQVGGDAIGLVVAGPNGDAGIALGEMRFGELTVALRRAFGPTPEDAAPVALRPALEQAIASLGQLSDDGPLGSSMVILVTPGLDDATAREPAPVAHTGALAGVTTTVVGLGPDAALAPMERVALAGQGRRRVLASASEAEDLATSEITAVSRVVARAVRLRIRLAEGVRLVGVLGSRSLDEVESTRVREAEQSIDRALAARLGIASDRGDDEDGIQIVVPAFYADDAHRVLLDVVVPGPGPVADVQVRYKDLVRLGNATLSDRLVLGRGAPARGPAQRAVAAAVLGHRVAAALREAATLLDAGRPDAARARLEGARAELEASTRELPELASEPATGRDRTLVRRYAEALDAQPADALARSLRYAAHRRLLGDPLGLEP